MSLAWGLSWRPPQVPSLAAGAPHPLAAKHSPSSLPSSTRPQSPAGAVTFDELQGLTYLQVKGSGIANTCPVVRMESEEGKSAWEKKSARSRCDWPFALATRSPASPPPPLHHHPRPLADRGGHLRPEGPEGRHLQVRQVLV